MKKVLKKILIVVGVPFVILAGISGYYKLCMDPYRGTGKASGMVGRFGRTCGSCRNTV